MIQKIFKLSYLFLFIAVGFVHSSQVVDIVGIQWFYLANLNGLFLLYILYQKLFKKEKIENFFENPINIFYSLYFIFCLISLYFSINYSVSIVALSKIFLLLTSLYIFHELNIIKKLTLINISLLFSSLLILEIAFSISGYFKIIKITEFEFSMASSFLKGIASNKNITSASIAFKIPFLYLLFYNLKNKILKGILLLITTLAFFNLILLSSRAIIVSFSLCVLFYILITLFEIIRSKTLIKKHIFNFTYFIIPIFFSIGVSYYTLNDSSLKVDNRISTINKNDESSNTRIRYYKKGIQYFFQHPIVGAGIGNWQIISIELDSENIESYIVPYVAHNDFIEVLTETGLFGGLFYVLFICSTLYFLISKYLSENNFKEKNNLIYLTFPFIIYFMDLNLNFPQYRPLMQSSLIVYILYVYCLYSKKEKKQL